MADARYIYIYMAKIYKPSYFIDQFSCLALDNGFAKLIFCMCNLKPAENTNDLYPNLESHFNSLGIPLSRILHLVMMGLRWEKKPNAFFFLNFRIGVFVSLSGQ